MKIVDLFENFNTTLYHGTASNAPGEFDVNNVRPLTHFGTRRAAEHRIQTKFMEMRNLMGIKSPVSFVSGTLYPVVLSIKNPLTINDSKGFVHSPYNLVDMLHYDLKVITPKERSYLQDNQCKSNFVVEVLSEKGFDSFAYKNMVEDEGSMSYCNFTSHQVKLSGEPLRYSKPL